ncbi:MAG: DUF1177 family protein [Dysosmobacter sp.]
MSIDTTKGQQRHQCQRFCDVSDKKMVSCSTAAIFWISSRTDFTAFPMQDITPYGNGLFHLNSILQPATATAAPVIGVAVTTEQPVAGCATERLMWMWTARFAVEVARHTGAGRCNFTMSREFQARNPIREHVPPSDYGGG